MNGSRIYLLLALAACPQAAAQISDLPYFEGFELSDGGYSGGGGQNFWQWIEPSDGFIGSASEGTRAWQSGIGQPLSTWSYLESPPFDFTQLTDDPLLEFDHIFNLGSFDQHFVEISIQGGPYARLGSYGDPGSLNWYNHASADTWIGKSGDPNEWVRARHALDGAAGGIARVRWRVDGSIITSGELAGIDRVRVFSLADVGVAAVTGPIPSATLGGSEIVTCTLINEGTTDVQGVDLSYEITGPVNAYVTERFMDVIPGLEERSFAFGTPADFSIVGDYVVTVAAIAAVDEYSDNDSASAIISKQGTVTAFPYFEDFETGTGGYSGFGTEEPFEWGAPSGAFIDEAASGSFAWVTNLDGVYVPGLAYLQSPVFDLASMENDPYLQFSHTYSIPSGDHSRVEVSIDGGEYQRLGIVGDPGAVNWGNGFWAGGAEWRTARHIVLGAAGQTLQVRWVLDGGDFQIGPESGVGIDDVELFEVPFAGGQPSSPGIALLDVNDAKEILGYPTSLGVSPKVGFPGPFFTSVEALVEPLSLEVEGPPQQPILLFAGDLAVGTQQLPFGQVDLDNLVLFASGQETGGLNPFFVTGFDGYFSLALTIPSALVGETLDLQAAIFDPDAGVVITNAVQATILP